MNEEQNKTMPESTKYFVYSANTTPRRERQFVFPGLTFFILLAVGSVVIFRAYIEIQKANSLSSSQFKVNAPLPTSAGEEVNQFYAANESKMKEIKVYQIVFKENTISTRKLVIDRQYEVYFINQQPGVNYELMILYNDAIYQSTTLSFKEIYAIQFDKTGRYVFKVFQKEKALFWGEIYVQ